MSVGITAVERLDFRFEPKPWSFAQQRRPEIDAFFAERQRVNPRLWNGRVLLMHQRRLEGGVLHGAFLETDYASFHSWLAWDRPPAEVWDCFGAAVVMASDGALLLGQMAAHTANAGRIYFPCGTPDPSDVAAGKVDFDHSIMRELTEETGLNPEDVAAEPGWTILQERSRLVAYKVVRAHEPAHVLRRRVEAHIAREPEGELTGIRFASSLADIDPAMPNYAAAFLRHRWGL
jgi:8-oxo-dGTP pyrophosphatase MutT (NUDIX family)